MSDGPLPTRAMLDEWRRRVSQATPFLRWAGGKQQFLWTYGFILPEFHGRYIEPFLGGGSVFFHIMRTQTRPCQSFIGDINRELISAFIAIRDNPKLVSDRLESLQQRYSLASEKSALYYELRDSYNATRPDADPALFIFINRTCWNGLYRLNSSGAFNVPFGAQKSDRVVPTLDDLVNASAALTQAEIRATSWQNTLAYAEPGDFVFLDPPYFSDLTTDKPKYQARHFRRQDHERLATALEELTERGIDFILTNSAEPEMEDLYSAHGLAVERIWVKRSINSKIDRRGGISEVVVRSPETAARRPLPIQIEIDLVEPAELPGA